MKTVAILYKTIPQYRREFFDGLAPALAKHSVELKLYYGHLGGADGEKADQVDLPWAIPVRNVWGMIGGRRLIWQACLARALRADLVIVEQANGLLVNHALLFARRFGRLKVAFWGHGRNLQEDADSPLNRVKRRYTTDVDWWFAYTKGVRDFVVSLGFPPERVTIVQNAIDTAGLRQAVRSVRASEIEALRAELGCRGPTALYCGGLYADKALDVLMETGRRLHAKRPTFRLLVVGAGPQAELVAAAAVSEPWLRYLGPHFGASRAKFFRIADVFLMPGLVGLAILDAFAAEVPLVTRSVGRHSPEIEYLETGVNGLNVAGSVDDYVAAVDALMTDENRRSRMRTGCAEAASRYTMAAMVANFTEGVLRCLDS